jgi:cobaltochelatase CobN
MVLFSIVPARIVSTANAYVVYGGAENFADMFRFMESELLGGRCSYESPRLNLWQGLYHPDSKEAFASVSD